MKFRKRNFSRLLWEINSRRENYWAFWRVIKGSEVPEHSHHHEQMMHVVEENLNLLLMVIK